MGAWEIALLDSTRDALVYFVAAPPQQKFALMGGVLTLASLIWNAAQILLRKVEPAPASWAVWASLDISLAFSMWAKNVLNPQMAVAAAGAGFIFLLSLPFGKPGWNPIDKWCLGIGFAALGCWAITGNPTIATLVTIVAIGVGCFPTYASIKEDRTREDKVFWCLAFASSCAALIGTSTMSVDALAQPVVFVLCQAWALWLLFKPERAAKLA